jgi:outer membrane immunogenic protein
LWIRRRCFYATGGLARIQIHGADDDIGSGLHAGSGRDDAIGSASGSRAVSGSDTRVSGTVGGGIERKFSPIWSAKLEYLHMDFGTKTYSLKR